MVTKRSFRLFPLVCAISMVGLMACGSRQNAAHDESVQADGKEDSYQDVASYPIPTSFEVIQLINRAGAGYIIGIGNPTENLNTYTTSSEQALNLGVYGVDLAYAATYQMKQETYIYLDAVKKLVDKLNASAEFNRELVEKVEKNMDNKDTLIHLVTNAFFQSYQSLTEMGRGHQALMIIVGSWIEGVYVVSEIALSAQKNDEVLKVLAEQQKSLDLIMALLNSHKGDTHVDRFVAELTPIHTIYGSLGGATMNSQQLQALSAEIAKVRNGIIRAK